MGKNGEHLMPLHVRDEIQEGRNDMPSMSGRIKVIKEP